MPGPGQNKWSADAERDLAMAIILSHGNITHDWPAVADKMTAWGYTFTLGSMSQHWSKKIVKGFKARLAENGLDAEGERKVPKKKTNKVTKPVSGKTSAAKRKVKDEIKSDSDVDTPVSKKQRVDEDSE